MLNQKGFMGLGLALLVLLGIVLSVVLAPSREPARDTLAAAGGTQEAETRAVVRQYLLDNPEVIVEALQAYETRQQAAESQRQRAAIVAQAEILNHDPEAPVLGNPEGDVTLVEFFDYRCPYCKRMTDTLEQLIAEDPELRVVMKEFPILSQESVEAARAALAAVRQEKYEEFHFALMEGGGSFTEDEIMAVAASVGLDEERLRADMQDPAIDTALRRNHGVAEKIGVTGTPAFIIGDTLLPGAVSIDQLRALIAETRAKTS